MRLGLRLKIQLGFGLGFGPGQQVEGVGGGGQDGQGFGAAEVGGVGVALEGQDLGESVDDGDQVDDLAGGGAGDQGLQAVLVGLAGAHEPVQGGGLGAGLGGGGVGLDGLGLDQGQEPARGQGGGVAAGDLVDPAGLVLDQPRGGDGAGGLDRDPVGHLVGLDPGPQQRVPVAQVDRVGQQRLRGVGVDAQQHAQLVGGELADLHDPVGTDPTPARPAGQHRQNSAGDRAGDGVGERVQVSPMCDQGEPAGTDLQHVATHLRQGGRGPGPALWPVLERRR